MTLRPLSRFKTFNFRYFLVLTLTFVLASCGGGGSTSSAEDTTTDNNSDNPTTNHWQDQYGKMTVGDNGSNYFSTSLEEQSEIFIFDDHQGNSYRLSVYEFDTSSSDLVLVKRDKTGTIVKQITFQILPYINHTSVPAAVTFNADGSRLFVATTKAGSSSEYLILEIDPETGAVLNQFVYARSSSYVFKARELRFADGRLYLRYFGSGAIRVFDEDLNDLGTLAVDIPYPTYTVGSWAWGSPALGQTFAVKDDVLYTLSWPQDRSAMTITAYTLLIDPSTGSVSVNPVSDWSFDLPHCFNCANTGSGGSNFYGSNTELLQRAFPGFWVADQGELYFPQMLYNDIPMPAYSVNSVDANGISSDTQPLNTSLYVLETEDQVTVGDNTYLIGNVTTNLPSQYQLGIGDQGFIMKMHGKNRDWIKLIEGGGDGVNLSHIRGDGAGGISIAGLGEGVVEGVDLSAVANSSRFTVNYDADFLANYEPDPNVVAQLEALVPSIQEYIVGHTWVYQPNGPIEARIVLDTNGSGSVRTYDSTGKIDGSYARLNWSIVDQDTMNFTYTELLNCDFYQGVWVQGSPGSDTLYNISVSAEGLQFNGYSYNLSSGDNGNPTAGGSCSVL